MTAIRFRGRPRVPAPAPYCCLACGRKMATPTGKALLCPACYSALISAETEKQKEKNP